MSIKGHGLNLGKVASGVVTDKKRADSLSESVFIERGGVLVLRRCCLHSRMSLVPTCHCQLMRSSLWTEAPSLEENNIG